MPVGRTGTRLSIISPGQAPRSGTAFQRRVLLIFALHSKSKISDCCSVVSSVARPLICVCREFAIALIWSSAAPTSCVRGSVLRQISSRRIFSRVGAGCRDSENGRREFMVSANSGGSLIAVCAHGRISHAHTPKTTFQDLRGVPDPPLRAQAAAASQPGALVQVMSGYGTSEHYFETTP